MIDLKNGYCDLDKKMRIILRLYMILLNVIDEIYKVYVNS